MKHVLEIDSIQKKFDLKTPGREDDNKLTIFNKKKMDYSYIRLLYG